MEGMISQRQSNWGKGWCDKHKINSSFYNNEKGYKREMYIEDSNRINNVLVFQRREFLFPSSFSVSSSSTSSNYSSISSSCSSSVSSDKPSDEEVAFYMYLTE
jgi:hypothetical protein